MTAIAYALYAIGAILMIGVVVVHVKRNPKLSAEFKAEFDKLHVAAEHLMDHLQMVHNAVLAPVSVTTVPAAPAQPTAPPAPALAPAAPPPVVNDSDPTAPGFTPPAAAAPAPAALPTEAEYTPDPHNLDFVRDAQMNVVVTDYAHLTVPDGWVGRLLIQTNVRPGTQPYSTTLNGAYRHAIDIPNNNNPYWLAYGVPPQPGDIPMADRVVRLDVQQPAGSTVVFDFQPQAA